jgi:ribosomal protein L35
MIPKSTVKTSISSQRIKSHGDFRVIGSGMSFKRHFLTTKSSKAKFQLDCGFPAGGLDVLHIRISDR